MRKTWQVLAAALLVWLLNQTAWATVSVKLEVVATGLTAPVMAVSPPDDSGRLFVVEQSGTVRVIKNGKLLGTPFLSIHSKMVVLRKTFDERGLLALAFHPDYQRNGKFYVFYSARVRKDAPKSTRLLLSHTQHISEMRVSSSNPDKADPGYEHVLMQIDWPKFNHNGGQLAFGPDGHLYIALGDGGGANDYGFGHHATLGNGQNLSSLHGSILRIDVNRGDPYGIPADNPFVGSKQARAEIYAYGFRNPWRMSFDMGGRHELFVGDVQQNSYEEVDLVVKGGNYGWRVREADHCFDHTNPNRHPETCASAGMIDPILSYNHCAKYPGNCKGVSVIGGYVYRGSHAPWQGKYFFGDWSKGFRPPAGQLFIASLQGDQWVMADLRVTNMDFRAYVLGFGQDDQGEVYVCTSTTIGPESGQGTLYKIVR
ncbi:MAG: PQQ-dependent sugar dehydrogenase [SAR324 cluster bacterium]|jgi:glucose/arabinose dehydrogenase|nr:PQQ-dependent sugar dehydrogenase [SAR324 cluster bacterium]MDP7318757.1 PQQ-dependent sugar dehydrogenase [SAR324 cluster bacterium]MDP7463379.1 PQQ-dependent sugar dehydrogenase [SAR324 cluster bacterium]MDP7630220.1 PQQ-dependent sugar dehydrogenase [SAR324 cluster bacterium]